MNIYDPSHTQFSFVNFHPNTTNKMVFFFTVSNATIHYIRIYKVFSITSDS